MTDRNQRLSLLTAPSGIAPETFENRVRRNFHPQEGDQDLSPLTASLQLFLRSLAGRFDAQEKAQQVVRWRLLHGYHVVNAG